MPPEAGPTQAGPPEARRTGLPLGASIPGAVQVACERTGDTTGGRKRVVFRVDPSRHAGAISEAAGRQIAAAARLAKSLRVPLVGVISSSGADVFEGVASLHGWGSAARALVECSGIVPVALIVTGPALSGPALLLGLADLVAMTTDAYAYVSGPEAVAGWTGRRLEPRDLGGSGVHARMSGVATFVTDNESDAEAAIDHALAYLPDHNDDAPPDWPSDDPPNRETPELTDLLPAQPNGSYDVRRLIEAIADDGAFLELRARWAPNLVTAFASIDHISVGVVANQPQAVAGTLDIESSQKGARFVGLCDAFNLPIVTLVDTSGFFPGKDLEWRGMIRHGAQLAFAYAEATVPRVSVITRKAYGGAYIVMDCKSMGNDLCVAWPSAEVAVMGAKGAVAILHRRETEEQQAERESAYKDDFLNPYIAAERGYIDAVIEPRETRTCIARALNHLSVKRETLAPRAHANGPL
jgi:acetyl-CoA carboxylase carboxyltransferase component